MEINNIADVLQLMLVVCQIVRELVGALNNKEVKDTSDKNNR
jgi:hypothetical protein